MEITLQCDTELTARLIGEALSQCEYDFSVSQKPDEPSHLICRLTTGREYKIDLVEPIRMGEVLDQIRKIEKNVFLSYPEEIKIGEGLFYPHDMLFQRPDTEPITLTEKESSLLVTLWSAPAHTILRDELLERIWGYRAGLDTHTLETHIYRLRQKIEDDPAQPRILLTIEDGYRLAI